MSQQENEIKISGNVKYSLNSVPCRIRFSGIHKSIPQHFHKHKDSEGKITSYLRGRKLQGKELKLTGLKGHVLLKQFDDVISLGEIKDSTWFERESHSVEIDDKIEELLKLSVLIHKN